MTQEFEKYHAVVLRSLVTEIPSGVHISVNDAHGTINCFQVNQKIGLMIKHSAKRMPPYVFTFTEDNLTELELLVEDSEITFVALVCGWDGFLTLSKDEIEEIANKKSSKDSLSIQVERRKRGMYAVGGRTKLKRSKPQGFSKEFIQAIEN